MKIDLFTVAWIFGTGLSLMPVENSKSQAAGDTLPILKDTYRTSKKIERLKVKEETLNQKIQDLASGLDSTKAGIEEAVTNTDQIIVEQKKTLRNVKNARYIVAQLIPAKATSQIKIPSLPLPPISYTIQPANPDHVPDRDIVPPAPPKIPFYKRWFKRSKK